MTINSTYFNDKKLYSISVGSKFEYSDYREFKAAYERLPSDAMHVELDLRNTNHLDSSALGMMLLMNESVHDQVSCIDVVNTTESVRKIFDVSHFRTIFNITAH